MKNILTEATVRISDLRQFRPPGGQGGQPGGQGGQGGQPGGDVIDDLNRRTDNHKPGQKEGKGSKKGEGLNPDDINKGTNPNPIGEPTKPDEDPGSSKGNPSNRPMGSSGKGTGANLRVDYSHINPSYNWTGLIAKFIKSSNPQTQETYAKPHRRSIVQLDVARQIGAAAMKPAEVSEEVLVDLKLVLILDCSGSMGAIIPYVFANVNNLLKQPKFAKTSMIICKFAGKDEFYKVNFVQKKAGIITSFSDNPKLTIPLNDVFGKFDGGGTELTPAAVILASEALAAHYNVLIVTDSDICAAYNATNIKTIMDSPNARKMFFAILSTRNDYIQFRQTFGASSNITYFNE